MSHNLKTRFLGSLKEQELGQRLLEHLPDLYFFVKDRDGRFIMANRTFLEKMSLRSEAELIGLRDFDIFPRSQAETYLKDDEAVMVSGKPQLNKIELIPAKDGTFDWYDTTKLPLFGKDGRVAGIAGITRDIKQFKASMQPFLAMEPVIRHITDNYADPITISDLAGIAGLPAGSFARRFKREFKMTPSQYLMRVRIGAASRLLAFSSLSISEISLETGFYDHSYFTKQFVKHKGTTPKRYRGDSYAKAESGSLEGPHREVPD